jgi:putative DNA primase/helicase
VTGSLAFGALARIVFFAARGEGKGGGEGERLFVRVKVNIGKDGGGFRYSLEQAPLADDPEISASGIAWGAAVEGSAGDLLAKLEGLEPGKGDSPALIEAKGLLLDMLTAGPMPQKELKAEAEGVGISWASVLRAKKTLGVQSEKAPGDGPWRWRLPERSP